MTDRVKVGNLRVAPVLYEFINNEALPREIIEQAERAMFEVAHDERTKDFTHVGPVLEREITKWQDLASGKQSLTGKGVGPRRRRSPHSRPARAVGSRRGAAGAKVRTGLARLVAASTSCS